MTYEQYWYGDVRMTAAYREADEIRRRRADAEAHLQGMYIYEALCCVSPVLHAFAKSGTKPAPYRTVPYLEENRRSRSEDKKIKQEQEDKELLAAKLYMNNMVRVGKKWGAR